MRKRNEYIGGTVGAVLSGAWTAYAHFTTARDLSTDAGWLARMITDPPVYAPWLLLVVCVLFLARVFWERDDGEEGAAGTRQNSSGSNSPNIGANSGTLHIHYGSAPTQTEEKALHRYALNDETLASLGRPLTSEPSVTGSNNRVNLGSVSGNAYFGDVHNYEPPNRVASPDTFSRVYDGLLSVVYVRPLESVPERHKFATSLVAAFRNARIDARIQTGFGNQEAFDGMIVKAGSGSQRGQKTAQQVVQSIKDAGFKVEMGDPMGWDEVDKLLILIGGKD